VGGRVVDPDLPFFPIADPDPDPNADPDLQFQINGLMTKNLEKFTAEFFFFFFFDRKLQFTNP
jgi:hypothetical protein